MYIVPCVCLLYNVLIITIQSRVKYTFIHLSKSALQHLHMLEFRNLKLIPMHLSFKLHINLALILRKYLYLQSLSDLSGTYPESYRRLLVGCYFLYKHSFYENLRQFNVSIKILLTNFCN